MVYNKERIKKGMKIMFIKVKKIFAIVLAICLLALSAISANAEENKIKINDETELLVDDTFTYSLYLSEATEGVMGIQMYVFYDKDYLEIDPNSVVFDTFTSAVYNAKLDGFMTFNWTDISNLADFTKKAQVVSMNFKVKQAGDTKITYFVKEMYGEDMTYLKSYKWTYDITKGDEVISSDLTPDVDNSDEVLSTYQGEFINYADGMGEDNTPNSSNHISYVGQKVTMIAHTYSEVTKTNDTEAKNSNTNVVVAIAIVLVVLALVAIFILRKKAVNKTNGNSNIAE